MTAKAVSGHRALAAAALLGALLPLAFAPFHLYPVAFILAAVLFLLWEGCSPRRAALISFVFGFAAFAAGCYWLYISIYGFGGAPIPVVVLLMLGGFVLQGLYLAVAGYLAGNLRVESRALRWCFLWPAAFTFVEWLRTWVFFGFPWLGLGYGQIDGPLRGWAPVIGIHGVSLVTLIIAGSLLTLIRGSRNDRLVAGLALAVVGTTSIALYDREWTVAAEDELRVGLAQGSIPQDRKWLPEQLRPTLQLYGKLTFTDADLDLVVWPEVAVPAVADRVQGYLDALDEQARERGLQLYLGILTRDADSGQYRNSLIGLGQSRAEYHKRHLVPFGEFFPVPDFARRWMRSAGLPSQDTLAGERAQPPLPVGSHSMAPSICYEDAFGTEQLDFLPEASLLMNVSNDAWFGDSIAPHQHLQIAQMRSLEAGRPMLRTTNTGITAFIGADGRIVARSEQFEIDVLRASVRPHTGSTPYMRTGNWVVIVLCLCLIGFGGYLTRR
ncbi:MAG: apolipoprotein N-acyltransferase [Gammaproteobacteria bacterium]|nr:apolipoprotein N-acyltransferase [Gammaproteobacteria bacterium]